MDGIDLDREVRRVDPDRWFASRFIGDLDRRSGVIALYAFDHELARADAASSVLMGEIRLAWWREAVDEIFAGKAPRRHPVSEALADAAHISTLPRGAFEAIIEARIQGLGATRFELDEAMVWAEAAQGNLAGLAAHILAPGADAIPAAAAGAVWGLVLLRRAGKAGGDAFDEGLRRALNKASQTAARLAAASFPAALCATLARADLRTSAPTELEKRARLTWAALSGRL